jgi:CDP-paratose 2-epimerase
MSNSVLITGSSGLIGSETALFFDRMGWDVHGVDNNMRREFFGPDGDTSTTLERVLRLTRRYTHHSQDLRHRAAVLDLVSQVRPTAIIHCASQPSHDLAKDRPFDDFDVNAVATHTLLEAARRCVPESPFVFMSTNKVYGDAPNERPLKELSSRWDYADAADYHGIDETCRIDATLHSLFGVSKLAADVMVQEYGRYFGMPTVCFRGGCLTGPQHAGAEMHGFLSYVARALKEGRTYRIYGYKGKQVRDNLHAYDVCQAFWEFIQRPRAAAVYNLGGGRENSVSVLEAIAALEERTERKLQVEYCDEHRRGDHICYISDLRHLQADYPGWEMSRSLETILDELAGVK